MTAECVNDLGGGLKIVTVNGRFVDAVAVVDSVESCGFVLEPTRWRLELRAEVVAGGTTVDLAFLMREGRQTVELPWNHRLVCDHAVVDGTWRAFNSADFEYLHAVVGEEAVSHCSLADYLRIARELKGTSVVAHTAFVAEVDGQWGQSITSPTWLPALLPEVLPFAYQETGIAWLFDRGRSGVGALLADEMGLGKTLQAIAWVTAVVKNSGRVLVVSPTSLTENWRRELLKFAGLESYAYVGRGLAIGPAQLANHSVVLTTYDAVRTNELVLQQVDWHTIVLDEAQYIKNSESQRSRSVKSLPRKMSVALTGTPVENRASELVSIMDFVVPKAFDDLAAAGVSVSTEEVSERLSPVLTSLMLRREVKDVGHDLPDRVDTLLLLNPSEQYLSLERDAIETLEQATTHANRLAVITKLRQLSGLESREASPKIEFLERALDDCLHRNAKLLIFAGFNATISLIVGHIRAKGIPVDTITGATKDRQSVIDWFSAERGAAVLVINPRAGGVGLNITCASVVIHFEAEWNPAIIDQATARAHRRGQENPVFVYYLRYAGSIEEYIDDAVRRKRELAADLITPTESDLTAHEIQRLISWLNSPRR